MQQRTQSIVLAIYVVLELHYKYMYKFFLLVVGQPKFL